MGEVKPPKIEPTTIKMFALHRYVREFILLKTGEKV